ncbi:hypothetical protein LV564_09730 [Komagataeibacter nataicola]|uniref:hypothetical protein n=1 Tax=Komagataeibacter nataicola TaxID=265960 RepID=UPI0011B4D8F5|nr:hypothetical protein [Komagataeibacter nataicola]WEQ54483.1 hypothetical protein LV564_09730 [Komagataeibacter nataicola]WNM08861.1 hypothetical protein RI056_01690 [Komagataeibacter nataicola]
MSQKRFLFSNVLKLFAFDHFFHVIMQQPDGRVPLPSGLLKIFIQKNKNIIFDSLEKYFE